MTHNQMTTHIVIAVEVHLVTTIRKITTPNTDNALHPELVITTTEVLLLHITLDHVMIIIEEILVHTVHHTDLHINPLTDAIHVQDTNPDLILEIITFNDTPLLTDLLQDLEILDFLDLAHILVHAIKSILYNHILLLMQLNLKYTCIILQKWQMHLLLQVDFIPYIHILH